MSRANALEQRDQEQSVLGLTSLRDPFKNCATEENALTRAFLAGSIGGTNARDKDSDRLCRGRPSRRRDRSAAV